MRGYKRYLWHSCLLASISLVPLAREMQAQNGGGQFRLLILPFGVEEIQRRDVDKFDAELKKDLEESGRYQIIAEDEVKDVKRTMGINVRADVPDSLVIPVAKELAARIILEGSIKTTEKGTIQAKGRMIDVLSGTDKKIGPAEVSVGTDPLVLADLLADMVFKRADVDKYLTFGKDYLRSLIFDRAVENFNRVIELDSTATEAYFYLGNTYLQMHDTTTAVGEYQHTLKLDPEYVQAAVRLGSIYIAKNDYEHAIEMYRRLVELEPSNYEHYLYLGFAYYGAQRFQEALDAYQKGMTLNTDEPRFHEYSGRIYYQMEKYDEAAAQFEEVLKSQPDNMEILQILAACYNQVGNYEKAIGAYERLVAKDPAFPNGYKYLGTWYVKLNEYNQAINALEKGLKFSPDKERPDIYLALVDVYLKAGRYDKVIEVGDKALSLTGNNRVYVFLGDAYQAMGEALEKQNTSASYRKAIEDYKASSTNYAKVVNDTKYGKYAQQNIDRNKSLIERAELIIKKLRLEEG